MTMRTTATRIAPWALTGGLLTGLLAARRWQRVWGATPEEVEARLPGDEILGRAHLVATRAVSVQAPPEDVWPWLVQLGQGRGGFYSYDRLQSLAGLRIVNAEGIVPEWQHLAPGEEVRLAPQAPLVAAVVDPDHALVLHGSPEVPTAPPMPFAFTWAFVLRPGPRGSTRLLVRERYVYLEPWAGAMVEAVQVASFVMTRRMLRGVRERAEYRPTAEAVP